MVTFAFCEEPQLNTAASESPSTSACTGTPCNREIAAAWAPHRTKKEREMNTSPNWSGKAERILGQGEGGPLLPEDRVLGRWQVLSRPGLQFQKPAVASLTGIGSPRPSPRKMNSIARKLKRDKGRSQCAIQLAVLKHSQPL